MLSPISLEQLGLLSGDTLLLVEKTGSLGGASAQRLFRQQLEKGDLYPNLPAVRSGRVVIL